MGGNSFCFSRAVSVGPGQPSCVVGHVQVLRRRLGLLAFYFIHDRQGQERAGLADVFVQHDPLTAKQIEKANRFLRRQIKITADPKARALSHGMEHWHPNPDFLLAVMVNGASRQFFRAAPEGDLAALGPPLDASPVSDTAGRGEHVSFTGAFTGIVAHDLTGHGWPADFTEFRYCPAD
jgi:xylan 1,4-beta-xylosidase